ncbi:hypothetical protein SCAB_40491 [Streptomyces scabiei 87.22]|uniref:Uncharacterized protein n=1 Tax=Streptomyces scabiei (strain 87.22) TaxID=680198 RepID=C9Z2B1_STRSW|nr:hypothetical protein SCAB_40491 [Streptomyces scabiei 87.22]
MTARAVRSPALRTDGEPHTVSASGDTRARGTRADAVTDAQLLADDDRGRVAESLPHDVRQAVTGEHGRLLRSSCRTPSGSTDSART